MERRSETWKEWDTAENNGSDVNTWLVFDLGKFYNNIRSALSIFMQNAEKSSKLPNSSKLDQDGSNMVSFLLCFMHMCNEKK